MTSPVPTLHPFDQAIALELQPDGHWLGHTSPAYANMVGPYGGITAAQMLNAVLLHPNRLGDPLALTVNYAAGVADGLYAADTMGGGRALTKLFYQAPSGAEVGGPTYTPDNKTLFLAIQHPGEDTGSSFNNPSTRWPDFDPAMPPRPTVIAIVKKDGGVIG
jgi:secreted PhoX family phosphatase